MVLIVENTARSALHLHVGNLEHVALTAIASSHFAIESLCLLFSVDSPHFRTLILEHLVELLGSGFAILVVLVNQDWSDNKLIESLEVVCTAVLLLFTFGSISSLISISLRT